MAATTTSSRKGLEGHLRREIARWRDLFTRHELLSYASAIAFQAFFALVALVLLGLGVLHALGREDVWESRVAPQVADRVLPGVFLGVNQAVERIFSTETWGLIAFASFLALWKVSGAVRACMSALSRIYDAEEKRPWWRRFLVSLALAALVSGALVATVLLVLAAKGAGSGGWGTVIGLGRWVAAVVLIGLAFGVLVRWAPAEPRAAKWATAGATLVVLGWIVESLAFRWYVTTLADFKSAVGSLTVFLVLTGYLYTSSVVLLVGMQLDELLRQEVQGEERHIVEHVRSLF